MVNIALGDASVDTCEAGDSNHDRLVTINEVAANGDTPVALNFQQAFNAPGSPWLTLVRNAVLQGTDTLDADNDAITEILQQ